MPLATGPHTVLVFEAMRFAGDWTRGAGTSMIMYTANVDGCNIYVLVNYGGIFTFSFLNIPKGTVVWVDDNYKVVHIPYKGIFKSSKGNRMKE